MRPWLFHTHLPGVGQFALSAWFSFLVLALTVGMVVAAQEARRAGDSPVHLLRAGMIGALAGVVGGRLGHLFTSNRDTYLDDPLALLRFWEGGMVLYGGLVLGVGAGILHLRRNGMPLLRSADSAAPALMLGIAIGRVGCLSAGCCYGRPIDWGTGIEWPWGIVFLQGVPPEILRGIPLHPTQVYSSLAGLSLFAGLRWLRGRQSFDGQVFGIFLIAYALMRSVIEAVRLDLERGFVLPDLLGEAISTSQAISLPIIALGVALLVLGRRSAEQEGTLGLDAHSAREARIRRRIEAGLAVTPAQ